MNFPCHSYSIWIWLWQAIFLDDKETTYVNTYVLDSPGTGSFLTISFSFVRARNTHVSGHFCSKQIFFWQDFDTPCKQCELAVRRRILLRFPQNRSYAGLSWRDISLSNRKSIRIPGNYCIRILKDRPGSSFSNKLNSDWTQTSQWPNWPGIQMIR